MEPIKGKIFSHLCATRSDVRHDGGVSALNSNVLPRWVDVDTVRRGPAPVVTGFSQLWRLLAEVSVRNHRFLPLLRGQGSDYRTRGGKTTLRPTLFRPPPGQQRLSSPRLRGRVALLSACGKEVRARRASLQPHLGVSRFPEFAWAILQHYEVCPTPLLDLTHSLRVAVAFAVHGSPDGRGYVYQLGVPYQMTGCISHSVQENMVVQTLLPSCPPDALRPLFQRGYLVGSFPGDPALYQECGPRERPEVDLGVRLLAKYRVEGASEGGPFWADASHETALPGEALFPRDDPFGQRLKALMAPVLERHRGDLR